MRWLFTPNLATVSGTGDSEDAPEGAVAVASLGAPHSIRRFLRFVNQTQSPRQKGEVEIKQLDAVFRLTDRTEKEASGSLVIRRLDRMIRSNGQSIKKLLNESPKAPSGRVANEVLSQVLRRFVSPSRRRAQLARPAHWATFSFQVDATSTRDEEKVNFYIIYCTRCTSTHPAHIKDSTNCSQLRTW